MRRNLILFSIGMAAYAAVLILSQKILAAGVEDETARIALLLSPMLPAVFICGVVIRSIRQLDELQRRLQLEALALAFAGTALITFGYGFLEDAGLPRLSMFAVWPLMGILWLVGGLAGRMRYR
jgi:hypothetical protein